VSQEIIQALLEHTRFGQGKDHEALLVQCPEVVCWNFLDFVHAKPASQASSMLKVREFCMLPLIVQMVHFCVHVYGKGAY
jgi:hypothetical protein